MKKFDGDRLLLMPIQHTIFGGQESTNNDFWDDYTLNLAETTLKRYLVNEPLNERLVVAYQVAIKRCKDLNYKPTVEEKLFFEKVEE